MRAPPPERSSRPLGTTNDCGAAISSDACLPWRRRRRASPGACSRPSSIALVSRTAADTLALGIRASVRLKPRSRKPLSAIGRPRVRIPPLRSPSRRAASECLTTAARICAGAVSFSAAPASMRANAGLPVAPHGLRSPDVPPCQRGEQLPRPEPLRAWPSAHSFELRTGLQPLLDLQGPDRWRTEQVRHLTTAAGGSSQPHGGRPAGEAAVFLGSGLATKMSASTTRMASGRMIWPALSAAIGNRCPSPPRKSSLTSAVSSRTAGSSEWSTSRAGRRSSRRPTPHRCVTPSRSTHLG
jgi:hypothetical protein